MNKLDRILELAKKCIAEEKEMELTPREEWIEKFNWCPSEGTNNNFQFSREAIPENITTIISCLKDAIALAEKYVDEGCPFDCKIEGGHPGCKDHALLSSIKERLGE